MGRAIPKYDIFIDWDLDRGLDVGNFELGVDGWAADVAAGTTTVDTSTAQAHLGDQSLLVTWNNVANPQVEKTITNLVIGRVYELSAWVFVPTSNTAVRLGVTGVGNGNPSTVTNDWQLIQLQWTATATVHEVNLNVNGTPTNGHQVYLDQCMNMGPGEDVSGRVLGVATPLGFRYGRDTARSLSAIQPGEISMEINNRSRDYSPDNASSPLVGYVAPGRPLLVRATVLGKSYDLFRGFIDDFTIDPSVTHRSIGISATDILGRLAEGKVATSLYPSVQTGEAIHKILDAIDWPTEKRSIDQGATTVRWWWEDGQNALDAINALVDSEGPPAFAFVSSAGNFVFRDRHHRLRLTKSKTSQATFRSDYGTEPVFSEDAFSYDIGWRDLVNDINVTIDEREATFKQQVWQTDDVFNVAVGQTYTFDIKTDDPFTAAQDPELDVDYEILGGTGIAVTMTRYSGQSTQIQVTCTTAAVIKGMGFQATPIVVARSFVLNAREQSSIDEHGIHTMDDLSLPWVGTNDGAAIARVILGLRSERLPVIGISLINVNDARTLQIMSRDLSDRIHIVESETSTDHDFFIEKIDHDIKSVGREHQTTFGCERVQTQPSPMFTFGVAGKGFDQGKFAVDGIVDQTNVFILGTSLLDTGLLGY